ncbi:Abi family protein [Arthrobacter mobilis]|uniref:Abi family protein n=1 Tax=Arthrobacter mobilis TaxID=2724944 RepID=A0A7X6HEZ7_9MICC|nr:Abi family protein [Arthrobacter mobilis]NKX55947.1 Abi family protein [Arthrobacter mobilis]
MSAGTDWTSGAHSRALDKAITPVRMSTYLAGAGYDPVLARRLYVWDRDVSVALLADIAILEVALRNALNDRLTSTYGPEWYRLDIGLDGRSRDTLSRAWAELPQGRKTPGHLVARLMFGFWRDLLSAGGFVGKEPQRFPTDYESLWRTTLHKAFPGGRAIASAEGSHFTRSWTLDTVAIVHAVRNRAAHHEPFISGFPLPGQQIRLSARHGHEACSKLAALLDRDLASWLAGNSSVPQILAARPRN